MDPLPEKQLDYEEYGEGAISALGEDKVIGDDDEYDELYKDINIGEGFLQFQQSHEAPGPSANGAVNEVNIGEDDECDELYSDINIGKGCLHPQLSEAPGPSANGAMNEVISEDEEYNELYGDIKIEEGFLQLHLSEAPGPSAKGAVNEGFQVQNTTVPEPRTIYLVPKESHIHGVPTDEKDTDSGVQFPNPRNQITAEMVTNTGAINTLQKAISPDMSCHNAQALNLGFRGSTHVAQNTGVNPFNTLGKVANEYVPLLKPNPSVQCAVSRMPPNLSNDNVNMHHRIANDNPIRPTGHSGATMLLVRELHWWTTDVEIESVSSKYGRVKEIKFFDEKANGKSKGCCQVEFYDSAAAAVCKEGMNGYNFNGRSCTVEFASPETLRQMGAFYMNKYQVKPHSQYQPQGWRRMNDRGDWGRGQGGGSRGSWHMRGTGRPGSSMHHQVMGAGFDPTYMGRGSGYGDFAGPFPGMMPPFPNVNAVGIPRVSPHVNPSFFGKGMSSSGKGMMGNAGMDRPHSGMQNDTNMGKWGAEEHGQRPRESSYDGKEGGSEYGYGESSPDKFPKSNVVSREKERASEREWSGNSNKRHRDERDHGRERYGERYDRERYDRERYDRERYNRERYDRERYDRERYDRERYDKEHRSREEQDDYHIHRRRYRDLDYKDDWDRGQASSRYRSRSRGMEVDHRSRSRSRDADYGKRSTYRRTHAL